MEKIVKMMKSVVIITAAIFLVSGSKAPNSVPELSNKYIFSSNPVEILEESAIITTVDSEHEEILVEDDGMMGINISVGGSDFAAKFYDNETSREIINSMPITVEMSDFNGQEKVVTLSQTPPLSPAETPETIHAGELYVWSGNNLVLFYTTFSNTYGGYIPIGYIEDTSNLETALGSGNVVVTLSSP